MYFYEDTHKYTDGENEYIPVTYFLKTFKNYVNWDLEAEKKAKKLKITKEELLAQWKGKEIQAIEKGIKFHKKMENIYNNQDSMVVENYLCPVYTAPVNDGIKQDLTIKLENNTVYPEKMIWSNKYKICGTADLVEVVNGKINIKDYKTNEKIEFSSYKHPILGSKKMKNPIQHLDDCKGVEYQLQINLYMYMLLQQNRHLKMGNMQILHTLIDENDNHSFITYDVPNFQKEVKNMLEYYKNK